MILNVGRILLIPDECKTRQGGGVMEWPVVAPPSSALARLSCPVSWPALPCVSPCLAQLVPCHQRQSQTVRDH